MVGFCDEISETGKMELAVMGSLFPIYYLLLWFSYQSADSQAGMRTPHGRSFIVRICLETSQLKAKCHGRIGRNYEWRNFK